MVDDLTLEWGLRWIPPGPDEESLEQDLFGWRPLRSGGWDAPPPPEIT